MIRRHQKIRFGIGASDIFFQSLATSSRGCLRRNELFLGPESEHGASTEAMAFQPALLRASAAPTSAR
jgi:hypothetical protein